MSIRKYIKKYKKTTNDTADIISKRIKKYRNYMKFDFWWVEGKK